MQVYLRQKNSCLHNQFVTKIIDAEFYYINLCVYITVITATAVIALLQSRVVSNNMLFLF